MLIKIINKKVNLFTVAILIITLSLMFLALGLLLGSNLDFLSGFATSTLLLGFGMLIIAFVQKIRTGKVPNAQYDEREKVIAYTAGFISHLVTVFALCIFTFVSASTRFTINVSAENLAVATVLLMTLCFFISMLVLRKVR